MEQYSPRSYSCSFFRREFRSAQGLGGHMNVQRRERAKLKQNPKSPSRVSSVHILRQESTTLASNSDAKSCVFNETNLYLRFDGFQFVDNWIGEDMREKGGKESEICVLDRGKGSKICVFNFHDVSCLLWRVGYLQILELNLNSR
ncbi:hypothetical protein L1987_17989 [Smallanthus sonchifolius]|uniref:Uncharacterized protein n=1 Tax=Smallanthus sonchifolius TaxID=185202 RepID=A0ACB9IZ11_9ASTR|nr:hypothetical protein L1987_17989 [Smallanthus sonchifolius]